MASAKKLESPESREIPGRSAFSPRVRDGLCRHVRNKGMMINIAEAPENDSSRRGYLAVDHNALAWDGTVWWCSHTSKPIGPDDRPCDHDRCKAGRGCFEGENDDRVV